MPSKSESLVPVAALSPALRRLADYVALTRPGINVLVGVATLAGFYMARTGHFGVVLLFHTLIGTVLVGSGAGVLNQVWERNSDALMARTRNRPISAGRIGSIEGTVFGLVLALGGAAYLASLVNLTAASVGAFSALVYVVVYTPLKSRTVLSTVIGAVPGGLPTLIGWTAAGGVLDARASSLFAILFLWQLPHFLAISWVHREDYERAGTVNLAVTDPQGRLCSRQAFYYSLVLLPVTLIPSFLELTGTLYLSCALVLGLVFIGYCFRFMRTRSLQAAKHLFWYSIIYLPVLYIAMMLDRI